MADSSDTQPVGQADPMAALVDKLANSDTVNSLLGPAEEPDKPEDEERVVADADADTEEEAEATEEPEELEASSDEEETADEDEEESEEATGSIELDGKTYTTDELREFRDGYQRQKDYTQKTQALSEERKEVAKERHQYLDQVAAMEKSAEELQAIRNAHAGRLVQALQPYENLDWADLASKNPEVYQQRKQEYSGLLSQTQGFIAEDQQITQQIEAQRNKALERQVAEARERLPIAVPGWDQEVYGRVREYAVNSGMWSQKEANSMVDWRVLALMHKAMTLDEGERKTREALEAAKSDDSGKVRRIGSKRTRKGIGDPKARKTQAKQARWDKAKQTGSINDAVDALRHDSRTLDTLVGKL